MSEQLADLREAVAEAIYDLNPPIWATDETETPIPWAEGKTPGYLARGDAAIAAIRDAGYCVVRRDDVRSIVCQPCQPAIPGTAIYRLRAAVAEG